MWDVKIQYAFSFLLLILSFTLTMWDVKSANCEIRFSNKRCFTLTMWDVKSIILHTPVLPYKFYLNYVGCKDELTMNIPKYIPSFTLTMWDVKKDPATIMVSHAGVLP